MESTVKIPQCGQALTCSEVKHQLESLVLGIDPGYLVINPSHIPRVSLSVASFTEIISP